MAWFDDEEGTRKGAWRPGINRFETQYGERFEANGIGTQILTVIDVHKPGKHYEARVFYTRQWRDPDGNVFGHKALRVKALRSFSMIASGYRYKPDIVALADMSAAKK